MNKTILELHEDERKVVLALVNTVIKVNESSKKKVSNAISEIDGLITQVDNDNDSHIISIKMKGDGKPDVNPDVNKEEMLKELRGDRELAEQKMNALNRFTNMVNGVVEELKKTGDYDPTWTTNEMLDWLDKGEGVLEKKA